MTLVPSPMTLVDLRSDTVTRPTLSQTSVGGLSTNRRFSGQTAYAAGARSTNSTNSTATAAGFLGIV